MGIYIGCVVVEIYVNFLIIYWILNINIDENNILFIHKHWNIFYSFILINMQKNNFLYLFDKYSLTDFVFYSIDYTKKIQSVKILLNLWTCSNSFFRLLFDILHRPVDYIFPQWVKQKYQFWIYFSFVECVVNYSVNNSQTVWPIIRGLFLLNVVIYLSLSLDELDDHVLIMMV
jgi:hypothetical protein